MTSRPQNLSRHLKSSTQHLYTRAESAIRARYTQRSARTPSRQQVGEAVAFLCSDHGRMITGVSLPVDGGVHLKT